MLSTLSIMLPDLPCNEINILFWWTLTPKHTLLFAQLMPKMDTNLR